MWVVAAVIAAVAVGIGAAVVITATGGDDTTVRADDGEGSASPDTRDNDDDDDDDDDLTSGPAPTPTTSPPAVAPAAGDGLPPGEWAAFLYAATSFGAADAQRAALAGFGNIQVLDSNRYVTLKPGFFVVYRGGFERSAGALDFCRATGRYDANLCYARYLSQARSAPSWNIPGTDTARPEYVAYP